MTKSERAREKEIRSYVRKINRAQKEKAAADRLEAYKKNHMQWRFLNNQKRYLEDISRTIEILEDRASKRVDRSFRKLPDWQKQQARRWLSDEINPRYPLHQKQMFKVGR